MTVAFDTDLTLIDSEGNPIQKNVDMYFWFQKHGYRMVVWSAAGKQHAQDIANKLGLKPDMVLLKSENMGNQIYPDVAVDDKDLHIARNMVKV
jgi:hypothetical protein